MDSGLWTLRCQSCNEAFNIELIAGQQIVEFAKSYACPNCKKIPDTSPISQSETWHHIIGFRSTKTNR